MNIDVPPIEVVDEALRTYRQGTTSVHIVSPSPGVWLVATGDVEHPYATIRVPQAA